MSAVGLPMDGHVEPHFSSGGFCGCPCDQCTARTGRFCVCLDCPCDVPADHEAEVRRLLTLYGVCEVCGGPRDIRVIETGNGKLVELICPVDGYVG